MTWLVATPHVIARASAHGGGRTIIAWQPRPEYGAHERPVDAMRAYLTALDPPLAGTSDEHIRRHWQPLVRTRAARLVSEQRQQRPMRARRGGV